jgi:acyl phosphate:glycerol-3-phosphate acyltransferase
VFPKFFRLQAACAVLALLTALSWWTRPGRLHRWRVVYVGLAALTVAAGWPISEKVSALRAERYTGNWLAAEAARSAFAEWHLISLLLSLIALVLVGVALAMAAKMPDRPPHQAAR